MSRSSAFHRPPFHANCPLIHASSLPKCFIPNPDEAISPQAMSVALHRNRRYGVFSKLSSECEYERQILFLKSIISPVLNLPSPWFVVVIVVIPACKKTQIAKILCTTIPAEFNLSVRLIGS